MVMYILALTFGFATLILFLFHLYLVSSNKTTIENMEPPHFSDGPDGKVYNQGCIANLQQVFGTNILLAFLPIFTRYVH